MSLNLDKYYNIPGCKVSEVALNNWMHDSGESWAHAYMRGIRVLKEPLD
jgi:hypothetical protein